MKTSMVPIFTKNSGFSLVEVIASVGVVSLMLLTVSSILNTSNKQANTSRQALEDSNAETYLKSYLSNPQYVGMLAAYPENADLKKCITNDSVHCDSSKLYDLTVYDIFSKKILSLKDSENQKGYKFKFQGICPQMTNECDSTSFINIKIIYQDRLPSSEDIHEKEQIISVKPLNTNVISMFPESSLKNGGPVNLIFILDTSNSMTYIKPMIDSGISQILSKLKDNEVNILLTSIDSTWKTYSAVYNYYLDNGKQVQVTTADSDALLNSHQLYTVSEMFIYGGINYYNIPQNPSSTQLNNIKSNISNFVSTLFSQSKTTAAYSKDIGLCHLLHILSQYKDKSISLNTDPQTPTLIYFISNENDESVLYPANTAGIPTETEACWRRASNEAYLYSSPAKTEKRISYYADQHYARVTLLVNYLNDGVPTTTKFTTSIKAKALAAGETTSICETGFTENAHHLEEIESSISSFIGKSTSWTMSGCTRGIEKDYFFDWDSTGKSGDLCKTKYVPGYKSQGIYYALDLSTCNAVTETYEVPESRYIWDKYPGDPKITDSFGANNIKDAVLTSLLGAFPTGNYHLNFSIIPSTSACPANSYTEVGTKFEEIASGVTSNSSVTPVCEGKFNTDIIADGLNKIETIISNTVTIAKNISSKVTGITIIKNGVSTNLNKTTDYSISEDKIVFKKDLLDSKTQVLIYYSF